MQIIVILEARGGDGSSLLTAAAEGGNKAIFSDASDLMGGKVSGRGSRTNKHFNERYRADIHDSLLRWKEQRLLHHQHILLR